MQRLGESWDVVEVVRCLVTEVDELRLVQKIVAGLEARVQVLEAEAEVEVKAEAKPKRGSSPSASGTGGSSSGATSSAP